MTISLCSVGVAKSHGFLLIDFVSQQKSIKCNSLLLLIAHDSSSGEGEADAACQEQTASSRLLGCEKLAGPLQLCIFAMAYFREILTLIPQWLLYVALALIVTLCILRTRLFML